MGASQVTENARPQVVIVTGKPACGKRVRMTHSGWQEASCRVGLATLNANMHLVKMSFARGRKMKASAELSELRAMLEVDPTGLGRRLSSSEACHFRCRSAEGKILPRTRQRWVRDTFGCEGIDRTICPLFEMRRPLLAFGSETAGQATRTREARRGYTQSIILTSCRRKPRCNLDQIARLLW